MIILTNKLTNLKNDVSREVVDFSLLFSICYVPTTQYCSRVFIAVFVLVEERSPSCIRKRIFQFLPLFCSTVHASAIKTVNYLNGLLNVDTYFLSLNQFRLSL